MGVEYYICCDDCKVYYHLGKNLRHFGSEHDNDYVPWAAWEFLTAHRLHRTWTDMDVADTPGFCVPEYQEIREDDDIKDSGDCKMMTLRCLACGSLLKSDDDEDTHGGRC